MGSSAGAGNAFLDDPESRDLFSAASLVRLTFGTIYTRRGPLRRSATIQLQASCGGTHEVGCFSGSCYGIFNRREEATVQMAGRLLRFLRERSVGLWRLENSDVGETTLGFGQRRMYWGSSTTRVIDGTAFVIKMPLLGPSSLQLSDCVCHALIPPEIRIRMFLKRPPSEQQLLFDARQAEILAGLSYTTRVALVGELLRIRALYA